MPSRLGYRVAAALLSVAWLAAFGLTLDDVVGRTAYPPFLISAAGPDAHPRVSGLKKDLQPRSEQGGVAGLAPGDVLLSIGSTDLRGAGVVDVASAFARFAGRDLRVPVEYERNGRGAAAVLQPPTHARFWPRLLASLAFAASAFVLLAVASSTSLVRTLVLTNLSAALFFACTFAGSRSETAVSIAVHAVSLGLAAPLALRVAQLFPHSVVPRSIWARLAPWPFAAIAVFDLARFYDFPLDRQLGALAGNLLGLGYVACAFWIALATYRRSGALARRQLKWMFLGAYLSVVPFSLALALTAADPRYGTLLAIAMAALGLMPIFTMVGIVRFNLFDVDRLVGSAASYSLLAIAVLAVLLIVAPLLGQSISEATGVDHGVTRVLSALVLSVLLVPAYSRVRPHLDRVFFAERHAFERGIEEILSRLGSCTSPTQLAEVAGESLYRLLRPEACLVFGRRGDELVPAFVCGRAFTPAVRTSAALVGALEEQAGPIAAAEIRESSRTPLDPFQRAILETLGVELVIPIQRGSELAAVVCLGPKRSGDIYTTAELALLTTLAHKISSELVSFEQAETIRESRALQERLRRYVPDSLAERLEEGESLESREAEVSVLFVDLRGYASFTESREPEEIFSLVNRYTEAVSSAVREHGGTVVEFNGDGMMAVFGAPRPHPDKEAAAVATGRVILDRVRVLSVPGETALRVGVGVATGRAYVGNVRAVDRLIWTALGDTTNLASRLQELTRDLDAAIVIDEQTHDRAGRAASGFVRVDARRIRGRRSPENLYLLPQVEVAPRRSAHDLPERLQVPT